MYVRARAFSYLIVPWEIDTVIAGFMPEMPLTPQQSEGRQPFYPRKADVRRVFKVLNMAGYALRNRLPNRKVNNRAQPVR
jgi:hypothetical protein